MPERITSILSLVRSPTITKKDTSVGLGWVESNKISTNCSITYSLSNAAKHVSLSTPVNFLNYINVDVRLSYDSFTDQPYSVVNLNYIIPEVKDINFSIGGHFNFNPKDASNRLPFYNRLPFKDVSSNSYHYSIFLYDNKPVDPGDQRYLPTFDFAFKGEEINFTTNFVKPIQFDNIKTPLSPINSVSNFSWRKGTAKDIYKDLKWGYSLNNFLIGGDYSLVTRTDPDVIDLPTEPPVNPEVITFVNIVNIVTLPARTPVQFDNLALSYDIDSVAWTISFNVATKVMRDLVKPTGVTVTELEVNVNGELFIVFIGKTSTSTGVDESGKVQRRIKCSGWSVSKLLSHPYHVRRSHVETSSSTPAGILAAELTGTGFTGVWGSVSWTIPANTFTYIDKTPLAALSELAQVVGAVIVPDPASKNISIKPRYPLSPWAWSVSGADINLSENTFFTMDTEWIPQESPDSIYIYGEAATGVAVKAVRSGQPGTKTLPTIVSKYFTDTIPATERGRIEVAKNGFKEVIPVTTYVNPTDGIIQPLALINVTESDGITSWKAQVIGVSLNLKRQGNALVQTIQLEKHYDI